VVCAPTTAAKNSQNHGKQTGTHLAPEKMDWTATTMLRGIRAAFERIKGKGFWKDKILLCTL